MIRPAMILISLLAASLGITLFMVKYQVQDLENQLVQIDRQITEDRQAIHVLKAEWSHLNEPMRLRRLAERHLGLGAVETRQVGTVDEWLKASPTAASSGPVMPLVRPAEIKEPSR